MAGYIDFYEVLGIARNATAAEIEATYDSQLKHLESGRHGMDAARAKDRIKLVNQAYWALSDKNRRAGYDASLETASGMPVQFAVDMKESRWTTPRGSMHLIKRVIVVILLAQFGYAILSFYVRNKVEGGPDITEQEKIRQGYDAINGKMSAEDRAAGEALAERQRQEAEAERARREQEIAKSQQERKLEQDRRYAAQVSQEFREAEENAHRQAENERQREVELEREKQEQERQRIERLQEKWQSGKQRQTRGDELD
ncbi:MAG: DnaJ domain-containing protein [Sulfuricellaceae bacterium]|nr:DnaJ domain-containing protein [Sulfuricellaceae bacterium]